MLLHSKRFVGLDRPDCHHKNALWFTKSSPFASQIKPRVSKSRLPYNGRAGRRLGLDDEATRRATATAAAASAAPSAAAADDNAAATDALGNFLTFLLANGVQGIGTADAGIGLYEEAATGERGVVALRGIAPGEVVLRVPLRLAITDADPDTAAAAAAMPCGGRAWQDRLAARLLRLDAAGATSPWRPYLNALPKQVPSAFETFTSDAAIDAVEYPPAVERLRSHNALLKAKLVAADAAGDAARAAIGNADERRFRWAHSIVGSRAFGNAAPGGGVGVRMLVPLVDMLNHAGDRTAGLLSGEAFATDNVRWDVISPSSPKNATGEWEMAVSAKSVIEAGEPLSLSYFEGANDEFLLHYGFVPPGNPHDDAILAPCVAAALEELWRADAAAAAAADAADAAAGEGGGGGGELAALAAAYMRALAAGSAALSAEVEAALGGGVGGGDGSGSGNADAVISSLEVVRAQPGGRVSEPLAAALDALCRDGEAGSNGGRPAEFLMAALARARLREMPTPLLVDLAALVYDARRSGGGSGDTEDGADDDDCVAAAFEAQLVHYYSLLSGGGGDTAAASSVLALAEQILSKQGSGGDRWPALRPPLARERRLAVEFRASKKMVLYDLLAAVAAAAGEAPADLEARIDAWASGSSSGDGGSAPPPSWQAHAAAADAPVWGAA